MSGGERLRQRLAGLGLLLCVIWIGGGPAAPAAPAVSPAVAGRGDALEQAFGIRVERVCLTARGNLVDVRFRVEDPDKAWTFLRRGARVTLHEADFRRALRTPQTPTLGALRQTTPAPVAGRVYFVLFDNTAAGLKGGEEVRIEFDGILGAPLCLEGGMRRPLGVDRRP